MQCHAILLLLTVDTTGTTYPRQQPQIHSQRTKRKTKKERKEKGKKGEKKRKKKKKKRKTNTPKHITISQGRPKTADVDLPAQAHFLSQMCPHKMMLVQ